MPTSITGKRAEWLKAEGWQFHSFVNHWADPLGRFYELIDVVSYLEKYAPPEVLAEGEPEPDPDLRESNAVFASGSIPKCVADILKPQETEPARKAWVGKPLDVNTLRKVDSRTFWHFVEAKWADRDFEAVWTAGNANGIPTFGPDGKIHAYDPSKHDPDCQVKEDSPLNIAAGKDEGGNRTWRVTMNQEARRATEMVDEAMSEVCKDERPGLLRQLKAAGLTEEVTESLMGLSPPITATEAMEMARQQDEPAWKRYVGVPFRSSIDYEKVPVEVRNRCDYIGRFKSGDPLVICPDGKVRPYDEKDWKVPTRKIAPVDIDPGQETFPGKMVVKGLDQWGNEVQETLISNQKGWYCYDDDIPSEPGPAAAASWGDMWKAGTLQQAFVLCSAETLGAHECPCNACMHAREVGPPAEQWPGATYDYEWEPSRVPVEVQFQHLIDTLVPKQQRKRDIPRALMDPRER